MTIRARIAAITAAALVAVSIGSAVPTMASAADPQQSTTLVRAGSVPGITAFSAGTTRLAGADRYATAVQVSKRYSPGVPVAFVATGANFPDALSAAAAAASVGGPLLLTPGTSLSPAVAAELKRLKPQKIVVVGGTGAVTKKVSAALSDIAKTTRLGGSDRYSTGLNIVSSTFTSADIAFIATGRSFPDALAASGAAGAQNAPVILVDGVKPSLPAATLDALKKLGVTRVALAGGTGAVSAGIAAQLTKAGYQVARHGGADRYETAAVINSAFFSAANTDTYFLATGTNFPDALAGAALAGRIGAPLFVTTARCLPSYARDTISALGSTSRVVMGGTTIVSDAAANNTACLLSSAPTITGTPRVGGTLNARTGTWTSGTSFTYQWYANGAAIAGASGTALTLAGGQAGKTITVTVTGTKSGFTTESRGSKATGVIAGPVQPATPAQPSRPSQTAPIDSWNCPSWAPIKGNASSMIYHVPGGSFYDRTNPEECFSSEGAAQNAGYRKSKR